MIWHELKSVCVLLSPLLLLPGRFVSAKRFVRGGARRIQFGTEDEEAEGGGGRGGGWEASRERLRKIKVEAERDRKVAWGNAYAGDAFAVPPREQRRRHDDDEDATAIGGWRRHSPMEPKMRRQQRGRMEENAADWRETREGVDGSWAVLDDERLNARREEKRRRAMANADMFGEVEEGRGPHQPRERKPRTKWRKRVKPVDQGEEEDVEEELKAEARSKKWKRREKIEKSEVATPENMYRLAAASVEPLIGVPYEQQVRDKSARLDAVAREIMERCGQNHALNEAPPVVESPHEEEAYRWSDAFSVGRGVDGDPKTVGHFVRCANPGGVVVDPSHLKSVTEKHKEVVKLYQEYIRGSGLAPCFGPGRQEPGHWRGIGVRTSRTDGKTMLVAGFHPQDLGDDAVRREKDLMGDFFASRAAGIVDTLYFRPSADGNARDGALPVFGETALVERLLDIELAVGPDSTLPPNLAAAELLVGTVARTLKMLSETGASGSYIHFPFSLLNPLCNFCNINAPRTQCYPKTRP